MKIKITTLLILLSISLINATQDQGGLRLKTLQQRSNQYSNRIIPFSKQDFQQYVMKYPRPYDVVIYFSAKSCKLCTQLYPEYQYMVELYQRIGAVDTQSYPTFFAMVTFSTQIKQLFDEFGFNSAPNLVVSKPQMSVISDLERRLYYQQYQWAITHTDGQIQTVKMLEFVNKRTGKDVMYKPTVFTMFKMFFGFIIVALVGVIIYTKLNHIWNHWIFWLVGSLLIYITCCSGIVYDILHDVPFVGRDQKTGQTVIFSDGNREQYGLQGWIVSISITVVGLFFIMIVVSGQKVTQKYSSIIGIIGIFLIYFIVSQLQIVYKAKGWYGPNFYPPDGYIMGPLSRDQGNNI